MSNIQFGAAVLFTAPDAPSRRERNQRVETAVQAYKAEKLLAEDDVLEVSIRNANKRWDTLVIDGEDFAQFGKDVLLKEREVQSNLLAQSKGVKGVWTNLRHRDQMDYGTSIQALQTWVAKEWAKKNTTETRPA